MNILKYALLLATAPLLSECFSWDFGLRMGYRWDDINQTLYDPDDTSQPGIDERFHNMSTAQISGFTTFRVWWLELGADADYGWTVGGHVKTTDFIDFSTPDVIPVKFDSDANGEVWDAFFTGGLRVPFYNRCDRGFFVTPLGGYSFNGIREKRRNMRPLSQDLGETEFLTESSDPTLISISNDDLKPLERNYKGPFAGASLCILNCHFFMSLGYAYHWIDLDQKLEYTRTIEYFFDSKLLTQEIATFNHFNLDRNRGNRGWLSLNYQDLCGWRAGLRGTYFSVSTLKKPSSTIDTWTLTEEGEPPDVEIITTTNPAKARWKTFSVMIEGSYAF